MEVKQVDPYKINVDEMNERKENLNLSDLEKSVIEQGIIQPPIVRERDGDHKVQYTVVVGQRRALAAQGAGLDSIPVVIMDWSDSESLLASITENIDEFQEEVSTGDRARAVYQLKRKTGSNNTELAEKLGVSRNRVVQWLEPIENWEGTELHVAPESDSPSLEEHQISPDDIGEKKMATIRRKVGANEMGEELAKQVVEEDLSLHDTEEIAQRIERGQEIDEAVLEVSENKKQAKEEKLRKISTRVQFTGNIADGLERAAKDRGTSDEDIVREAAEYYLQSEGYL